MNKKAKTGNLREHSAIEKGHDEARAVFDKINKERDEARAVVDKINKERDEAQDIFEWSET
jgi:uncharacterized coiled-coil DUF342 family protein